MSSTPTPPDCPGLTIHPATLDDAPAVAALAGELLGEIMDAIGERAFQVDLADTTARLRDFLIREKSFVFVARATDASLAGFLSLYEGHALYAGGAFGTIAELYVRPTHRDQRVGAALIARARAFGQTRGWTRLEVTTPPLPQFDRSLAFYQREGFAISGGRKLKTAL